MICTGSMVLLGVLTRSAGEAGTSEMDLARGFAETVRPFLENYCLTCHGHEKPKSDFDLSPYVTMETVVRDPAHWEMALEKLQALEMPPEKAKRRPAAAERQEVVAWIQSVRQHEAEKNAGDPGLVAARRLSNAEYDYTIRDLTGVDIRPTREFPVDPANEAGFDNSAESLGMSPALLKKYIEAARRVSEYLVLKPNGLAFAPHPVVADTDRDKYNVRRIIDFYQRHSTNQADYFLAAWRFKNRAALGSPVATLDTIASEARISARYLSRIWTTLTDTEEETGPIAALQAIWCELPPGETKHLEAARSGCERMQDFVVQLRGKLVPVVKNLTVRGMNDGSQPLVLWKDREFAANRRRYAGGALDLDLGSFNLSPAAALAMAIPEGVEARERYERHFQQFCETFPDAFYISERARVYLDPEKEKKLGGRLLSAGFHSMTGYFRDDQPLYDLILDEGERRELDTLWQDFDFISSIPTRMYTSFLWFERSDSRFMMSPEFHFARAEDKDCTSETQINKLAEIYLAKAQTNGASEVAQQAIRDHFRIVSTNVRRVESMRKAAEPTHLEAIASFAERAYRRPLRREERDGLLAFYRSLRQEGGLDHEEAVRDTLVGILMSPHFCYRLDLLDADAVPARGAAQAPVSGYRRARPLSDYALASRLSYFLWSSMPDEVLLARAAAGDVHRPEVLRAQIRRMLLDGRARALITEFGANWLDFRRFEEHNAVDRERFPVFNNELRQAMFEEPIRFFLNLIREDRSVLDFLYADYTFVNPVLAKHYAMPEIESGPDDWRRIENASRYERGGLLPMAVFLTKNAPGLRTSPVKRGYWVVRRLLGERIPPPPPNVPELPGDEGKLGDLTLREVLAKHRQDKACAGCHGRFDAMGLVFEGYGPVGEKRSNDLAGRPVETRATFPGGSSGTGLDGLRTYLREQRQQDFVDNLCRKLLAYGLGRNPLLSDELTLTAMKTRLASDGYRLRGLIETIVTSPQFLNKRREGGVAQSAPKPYVP